MSSALKLTDADWIAIEREHCQRHLSNFVREAWHVLEPTTPYVHGWHIDAIAEHLEAVSRGEIRDLLINVPPRFMKSLLVAVFWVCWIWARSPSTRWLFASYAQQLSVRDSLKCRRLVLSPWYQRLWGDRFRLVDDQNAKTRFENDATGYRIATAVGAAATGEGGDVVVVDDPHSAQGAASQTQREGTLIWWDETMSTRLNDPKTGRKVIVMQRLHERDLSGHVLEQGGYEHLCLPMEYEPERHCATSIGWEDPRTEAGELLWPERLGPEEIAAKRRELGEYGFAGQFQQRPSPRGGVIFKDEWWRYYTVPPRIQYRIIYADTAQKTKEKNDYSVFECWGKTKQGQLALLDMIRGKWESPELLAQARAFYNKHKSIEGMGVVRALKVEDKVSGTGLIQTLRREGIPVVPIPRSVDKVTRAYDAAPLIESGNVLLPQDAPWLSDFLAETSVFPNGAHDDIVDAMMDAVSDNLNTHAGMEGLTTW